MNLKVVDIFDETHDTKTFYLEDADEGGRPYDFIAGQYLTFRFDNIADKPIVRSYTMSGSPRQETQSIFTVKRVEKGLISNWLCDEVVIGTVLRARGPIGMFTFNPAKDAPNLYMVAGGSGVTPFISIIREYRDKLGQPGAPKSLNLLVAYKTKQDLICWREISDVLHHKHDNIKIVTTLTRENLESEGFWHGRPDGAMLEEFIGGAYQDATFMSCGPQAIMDMTKDHLILHGVNDHLIKTESFES